MFVNKGVFVYAPILTHYEFENNKIKIWIKSEEGGVLRTRQYSFSETNFPVFSEGEYYKHLPLEEYKTQIKDIIQCVHYIEPLQYNFRGLSFEDKGKWTMSVKKYQYHDNISITFVNRDFDTIVKTTEVFFDFIKLELEEPILVRPIDPMDTVSIPKIEL